FTSETWRCAFDIREPMYTELCHEFFSTFEFDEEVTDEELIIKKLIKFRLGGRRYSLSLLEFSRRLGLYTSAEIQEEGFHVYFEEEDDHVDEEERCQYSKRESLDTTTLRELIGPNERLISEDPSPGIPRFAMPRPLRLTLQDLSDRMGRMEIQQGVLKSNLSQVNMDDPNITMEEYIRLEEEKARRHSKVYNWETATYGRFWNDDEVHNLKSIETKFPAIVFDDTFTSQAALSREPTVSPLSDDEIDFRISFDEYDDEHYTGKLVFKNGYGVLDMALPYRNHRHSYLRLKGLEYTDVDIMNFEERLGRIYGKEIHRVQVFDFGGLTDLMAEGLSGRMLMEHRDAQGQIVFTSQAWRRLFEVRGLLLHDIILEFFSTFRFGEAGRISSVGDFLGTTPSYTSIRDPMLRLCHMMIACSITRRSQAPDKRKHEAMISRGQFVACLAEHFRLLTEERLQGLMPRDQRGNKLLRLLPPEVTEDALAVYEGAMAILAPVQAPQPVAGPSRTMVQRIARLEGMCMGCEGHWASRERKFAHCNENVKVVKTHVFLLLSQLLVRSKNEESWKKLSGVIMIAKMVKLHRDL
nr:hypothetical protein [Tanacetum cinerariifolium]